MTTSMPHPGRQGALAGTAAGLGAAWAAVVTTGRWLPAPGADDVRRPLAWVEGVGPEVATFSVLRVVAAVVLVWLSATIALGAVARALRLARAVRLIDRVSVPAVRRLAELGAGAAVVAGTLVPGVAHAAGAPSGGSAVRVSITMQDIGPAAGPQAATSSDPSDPAGSPSTATSAPAPTSTTTTPTTAPPPPAVGPAPAATAPSPSTSLPSPTISAPPPTTVDRAPADPSPADPATPVAADEPDPAASWVVAPGDTLWHVAEVTATHRLGRPATPREVLDGLDRLIALNADRLAVPGNADLVFPGQVFLLP